MKKNCLKMDDCSFRSVEKAFILNPDGEDVIFPGNVCHFDVLSLRMPQIIKDKALEMVFKLTQEKTIYYDEGKPDLYLIVYTHFPEDFREKNEIPTSFLSVRIYYESDKEEIDEEKELILEPGTELFNAFRRYAIQALAKALYGEEDTGEEEKRQ